MKIKLIFTLSFFLVTSFAKCQLIDRFGINAGATYSTQNWSSFFGNDNKYKLGPMAFIQAEKDFGKLISLRAEVGYIQKGFKNNLQITNQFGSPIEVNTDNVNYHDLALNIAAKIKPFISEYAPYFIVGARGDYTLAYKDAIYKEPITGQEFGIYQNSIDEFNKFNLGGIFGVGFDISKLLYFEFEFNPSFTKSYNSIFVTVRDICFGAKLGINLNQFIK